MTAGQLAAFVMTLATAFVMPGPAMLPEPRNTLAGLGARDATFVMGTHVVLEILGYTLIALTLARAALRAACLRATLCIDGAAGAVLATLGLRLLLSR